MGLFKKRADPAEMVAALRSVLRECADWHGTPEVRVTWANREGMAHALA